MEPTTNYERWRLYTADFVSPDNYIDWGFYYLISAALQRRVWVGSGPGSIFPNMYTILVGDPAVGKGLVVKQIAEFLKHHRMRDPNADKRLKDNAPTDADRAAMEEVAKTDYNLAAESEGKSEDKKGKNRQVFEKPLLLPVAADATTYEALVRAFSMSLRRINYKEYNEELKREVMKIYTHSSLCFCLEEISSLFRKNTEDVVHFLLQAYDCGDYEYDTKTQGKDRIKKCCLNFFGGTTPGFMQDIFDDQLLTEGFSSRTFFVFSASNRKSSFWIPDMTREQLAAKQAILEHIEKLTHLYGSIHITPETRQWLQEWWKTAQLQRPNTSLKLNAYYGRKNLHVTKLAMALHFGESTEMAIPQSTFERSIQILAKEEKNMHLALGIEKSNPLTAPIKKILKYLEVNEAKTFKELLVEFFDALPSGKESLEQIIDYLVMSGKMKLKLERHTVTGIEIKKYTVMKESEV
jgi:hypothetical protein